MKIRIKIKTLIVIPALYVFSLVGCLPAENNCVPGTTQTCICSDGVNGGQVCSDDGQRWSTCDCTGGSKDDGGTAGDAGPTADAVGRDLAHNRDATQPDTTAPSDAGPGDAILPILCTEPLCDYIIERCQYHLSQSCFADPDMTLQGCVFALRDAFYYNSVTLEAYCNQGQGLAAYQSCTADCQNNFSNCDALNDCYTLCLDDKCESCPVPNGVANATVDTAYGTGVKQSFQVVSLDGELLSVDGDSCSRDTTQQLAGDYSTWPCDKAWQCGGCLLFTVNLGWEDNPNWTLLGGIPGTYGAVQDCPQYDAMYDMCWPNCHNKICGTDGCGGSCGSCSGGEVCSYGRCTDPCHECLDACRGMMSCCQGLGCMCDAACD